MQSYETRQKEYAFKGQKHFYFMTLNGNEVIDAGAKGNLGRFINHSCEPNCRTEKVTTKCSVRYHSSGLIINSVI
jgi:SET domain-containing protein